MRGSGREKKKKREGNLGCVYVLTAGNDQWVRVWEVRVYAREGKEEKREEGKAVHVRRVGRTRTNVADVSSMCVLGGEGEGDGDEARVVVCGVGMEVVRVEWEKTAAGTM